MGGSQQGTLFIELLLILVQLLQLLLEPITISNLQFVRHPVLQRLLVLAVLFRCRPEPHIDLNDPFLDLCFEFSLASRLGLGLSFSIRGGLEGRVLRLILGGVNSPGGRWRRERLHAWIAIGGAHYRRGRSDRRVSSACSDRCASSACNKHRLPLFLSSLRPNYRPPECRERSVLPTDGRLRFRNSLELTVSIGVASYLGIARGELLTPALLPWPF